MSHDKNVFAAVLAFGVAGTAALAFGDTNLPGLHALKALLMHPAPPVEQPLPPEQFEAPPSLGDVTFRLSRS